MDEAEPAPEPVHEPVPGPVPAAFDEPVATEPVAGAAPSRPLPWPPPRPAEGAQYPIPPAAGAEPAGRPRPGPVPTWAFRAPSTTPAPVTAPAFVGDLSLDPMSLRRRATIRSGTSSLTVDETRLVQRVWWRRSELGWADVLGFEPRFEGPEGSGRGGRLVALTNTGPVELVATRRPTADLRYLHALLDAYRQRAHRLARR
jgi:hypothetical protein